MSHRVSLTTLMGVTSSKSTSVEVNSSDDLRRALESLGARRFARYWRDLLGDGHVEGNFQPIESFGEDDYKWVTTEDPNQRRQISYE
jgi:hypothetical protein